MECVFFCFLDNNNKFITLSQEYFNTEGDKVVTLKNVTIQSTQGKFQIQFDSQNPQDLTLFNIENIFTENPLQDEMSIDNNFIFNDFGKKVGIFIKDKDTLNTIITNWTDTNHNDLLNAFVLFYIMSVSQSQTEESTIKNIKLNFTAYFFKSPIFFKNLNNQFRPFMEKIEQYFQEDPFYSIFVSFVHQPRDIKITETMELFTEYFHTGNDSDNDKKSSILSESIFNFKTTFQNDDSFNQFALEVVFDQNFSDGYLSLFQPYINDFFAKHTISLSDNIDNVADHYNKLYTLFSRKNAEKKLDKLYPEQSNQIRNAVIEIYKSYQQIRAVLASDDPHELEAAVHVETIGELLRFARTKNLSI